jgi:predicted RNA-binding Zn-ribbon protein involved in translation (DUF1610 family)
MEAARGDVAGMNGNRDLVYCPSCGSDLMYRLERSGVIQRWVNPLFGFYPWQCKACGAEVMLRKRHRRRRKLVSSHR